MKFKKIIDIFIKETNYCVVLYPAGWCKYMEASKYSLVKLKCSKWGQKKKSIANFIPFCQ